MRANRASSPYDPGMMRTVLSLPKRPRLAAGLLAPAFLASAALVGTADAAPTPATPAAPTVLASKVIGHSVRGRPIRAYRLGDPTSPRKAVVLGSIHGDETAGIRITDALRRGRPLSGVDLWVVPTVNPDGVARGTRQNVHRVDLNRNFPHRWAPLTGRYYSGPTPLSEPEARALRRFLDDVRPRFMVSFHQPLHGVGRDGKARPFQRRLARNLDLPVKSFDCSGVCHGTMTSWYNHHHAGTAITVELGYRPTAARLRAAAPATVRALLGSYAAPADAP